MLIHAIGGRSVLHSDFRLTIQVHPQPQADPSEETIALLRVLLYKADNITLDPG